MRTRPLRLLSALLLLAAGLAGCDTYGEEELEPPYVVQSYLVAGEPLPEVRLSRAAPFGTPYAFGQQGVSGAEVVVSLLAEDGSVERTFPYASRTKGVYDPSPGESAVVIPGRRYGLEITFPDRPDRVRSATRVPGAFELVGYNADTLQYQSTGQLEARLTQSFYPGRQSLYVFTTEALDTIHYDLTPFYRGFAGDDRSVFVRRASPIINERSFTNNGDGTITARLPWIAIPFFGPNRVTAQAVDDNLYDFIRSRDIQAGGSTLSPGHIENVLDHVEGGTGVFGSYAASSVEIFVKE